MEPSKRTDDAARAAWLSYIGGKTQDEIAQIMGVSRQSVQRLISQAMGSGIVQVRIDHPIARCLELAAALKAALGLALCEVVPTLPGTDAAAGVAQRLADILEMRLAATEPLVFGLGTGRTLRAAVEAMARIDCDQHKIVSLTGNISADGSTAYYNVLFTMSEKVSAPTYPLPMPVIATSNEEREALLGQKTVQVTKGLARQACLNVVGIGELNDKAPLLLDGFITRSDLAALRAAGAVGEILGWAFDAEGRIVPGLTNDRVTSAPLAGQPGAASAALTLAAAKGDSKRGAIVAAARGGLIGGLVTDEATAEAILARG